MINNPSPIGPPLIPVSNFFSDVWSSTDGETWEPVTANADWVERPGHVAVVAEDNFLVFGGFGLSDNPEDPFAPSNPIDMWVSEDGTTWDLLDTAPWNATMPD